MFLKEGNPNYSKKYQACMESHRLMVLKEVRCLVFAVKQLNGLGRRQMLSISKVSTIYGVQ